MNSSLKIFLLIHIFFCSFSLSKVSAISNSKKIILCTALASFLFVGFVSRKFFVTNIDGKKNNKICDNIYDLLSSVGNFFNYINKIDIFFL